MVLADWSLHSSHQESEMKQIDQVQENQHRRKHIDHARENQHKRKQIDRTSESIASSVIYMQVQNVYETCLIRVKALIRILYAYRMHFLNGIFNFLVPILFNDEKTFWSFFNLKT